MSAKIGGQAVLEGVMLKSESTMAVAVRKNSGEIALKFRSLTPLAKKAFLLRVPFVRGFFQLFSLMLLGFEALKFSVDVIEDKENEAKANMLLFIGSAAFAIGFTVLFFFILPLYLTELTARYLPALSSHFWYNLYEGTLRVVLFLLYLVTISFMKDIRRVFEYHGAEHKVIAAYEQNEILLPENVQKYSRFHPRCGTSFLILVVLLSIVFFSIFRSEQFWGKFLIRLVAFPVLSGVIYEILRLEKIRFLKPLFLPGLWLQHLTTREPGTDQIEVAIKAHEALQL